MELQHRLDCSNTAVVVAIVVVVVEMYRQVLVHILVVDLVQDVLAALYLGSVEYLLVLQHNDQRLDWQMVVNFVDNQLVVPCNELAFVGCMHHWDIGKQRTDLVAC